MKLRHAICAGLAGIFITASANATTFYIDEFRIARDNNPNWFVDSFDDGSPPPSGSVFPDGFEGMYSTVPNPLPGPENLGDNGKLTLDTADGSSRVSSVTGREILLQRARLLTSTDDNNDQGLKDTRAFEVRGLFDLVEPTLALEFYGIRLTDFGTANPNDPNDNVGLWVQRTETGEWRVRFMEADFGSGVFDELGSYLLPDVAQLGEYEQIALMLTKVGNTGTSPITASFELIDTDAVLGNVEVNLGGSALLFDGERWTRAAFLAAQVLPEETVPVPATLLLIGLGLVGIRYRRRQQIEAV